MTEPWRDDRRPDPSLGMAKRSAAARDARPILADDLAGPGWPAVAVRQRPGGNVAHRCRPVTHSYAALAFYIEGRARIELSGEWDVRAGDVVIVPAGAPHRAIEIRDAMYWGAAFCVPCLIQTPMSALLQPFERVRDGASAVVSIPMARRGFLAQLFGELEALGREPRGPGDALDTVFRSLLTLILNEVNRAASFAEPQGHTGSSVAIESLRFIERNCLGKLTLAQVAAAVGRTPAYVTTVLRKATGRSAGAWIVSGRMAEARRLLLRSDEMVEIIAERVGYADATHFIRMFKRAHGATPAAWRAARGT